MECDPVETFRRLFGVEALVDIKEKTEDRWTARFYGNMCYTCGAIDYFDDFAGILSHCTGEDWAVETYTQLEDGSYLVTFRPRRLITRRSRHIKIVIDKEEQKLLVEVE